MHEYSLAHYNTQTTDARTECCKRAKTSQSDVRTTRSWLVGPAEGGNMAVTHTLARQSVYCWTTGPHTHTAHVAPKWAAESNRQEAWYPLFNITFEQQWGMFGQFLSLPTSTYYSSHNWIFIFCTELYVVHFHYSVLSPCVSNLVSIYCSTIEHLFLSNWCSCMVSIDTTCVVVR